MRTTHPADEHETRQRLLDAGARLFAERGFKDVSIREICAQAGSANVAAVNYYFRDKVGLYRELLEYMVDEVWRPRREQLEYSLEGKTPEEKLYLYVRNFLADVMGENQGERAIMLGKVLHREMVEPSPEFEIVVRKGMQPNFRLLTGIIGEVAALQPDDLRTINCANSTMGQCLIFGSAKQLSKYFAPGMEFTSEVIDGIARHVTQFSLAGIRATAASSIHVHP
ncbi:MAG: TetR/AcrR family transcriptional regulator [Terriglobia bacterium]